MTDPRLRRCSPALRRAIAKVRPEYFAWSAAEHEGYAVSIPEQDRDRLLQALFRELWGRKLRSPRAADRALSGLSADEQNRLNETLLPLLGIGADSFQLTEYLAEGKTILDFPTLRAYDEYDHRFQEEERKRADPRHRRRAYRGSLYLAWARLFVGTQFTYATLSLAAEHIRGELEEVAAQRIAELIPHRYVPGPEHDKRAGEFRRWDMQIDAGGQEALLAALSDRAAAYVEERREALRTAWDRRRRRAVYVIDESESPERNLTFIFSDKQALAAVRFRSFLKDCRAIERSVGELTRAVEEEKRALAGFVDEQYAELCLCLAVPIEGLRKRRKRQG